MKRIAIGTIVSLLSWVYGAQAALIVYEGFDYAETTGGINTATLDGGTGLSGAWTSTDSTGAHPNMNVEPPGDSWGSLTVSGNRLHRTDPGGIEALSRPISADVDQAAELWFSLLHDADATSQFAVAGDGFSDGSSGSGVPTTPGFGLRATGNDTGTMVAQIWGNTGTRVASGDAVDFGDGLRFFVGHVQFNAGGGGEDILSLYDVGTDLLLPLAPFSTAQADVDETQLDTLTMSTNRGPGFDEILLATTMEEVGILGVVPEPTSLVLLLGGGAMIAMLRRRIARVRV